jgi:hypothetical protein
MYTELEAEDCIEEFLHLTYKQRKYVCSIEEIITVCGEQAKLNW